jgi:small conductance mechanosensitive channel
MIEPLNISEVLQNMLADFIASLPGVIAAMVVVVLTLIAAGWISSAVRRGMQARKSGHQPIRLVTKITYFSILIFCIVIALQQVGFNLTAFLTGLGVVGFTVGFALQDVSKNFVSGLILIIQQPFAIGDAIKVTDYGGTIVAIDLRSTEIHTWDGQVVIIPNSDFLTNPITNYSRASRRRVDLGIGVSYGSDLEQVRKIALGSLASVTGLLDNPPPKVQYEEFGASTINLTIYFWIDALQSDPFTAKDTAMVAIKAAFERNKIDMPFPTQRLLLQEPNLPGVSAQQETAP